MYLIHRSDTENMAMKEDKTNAKRARNFTMKIRLGDSLNTLKFFRDLVASLEIVRRKIYFTMVTNEQQT